jgi:hypothetical protein
MKREAFKATPKEITKRMRFRGVMISDDLVADILDAYKLLKEGRVDEETLKKIKKQGRIIIGCDGTPSETGKPSFWTFYDVAVRFRVVIHRSDHLRDWCHRR